MNTPTHHMSSRPTLVSPATPGMRNQHGMSMFELLIVVAVIAAVVMIALPQLTSATENYRLNAAAREVSGNLGNTRILAVTENSDYRVRVPGPSQYLVEEDVAGTWTQRNSYDMPAGFTIGTTGAIVEFHRRGNAAPVATFLITNPGGATRQVVSTTSGRSYVQ